LGLGFAAADEELIRIIGWTCGCLVPIEIETPKVWGGSKKLNPNALAALAGFADKNDAALLLVLRKRILDDNHVALIYFVLEVHQAAVDAYYLGLANLAEFAAL
jgi:hypothetical protein